MPSKAGQNRLPLLGGQDTGKGGDLTHILCQFTGIGELLNQTIRGQIQPCAPAIGQSRGVRMECSQSLKMSPGALDYFFRIFLQRICYSSVIGEAPAFHTRKLWNKPGFEFEVQHRSQVMDEAFVREGIRHYLGMVSLIDQRIGDVIGVLEDSGEIENTWIIYCCDHGEMLGEHHTCGPS